ncbi:MAG: peptide ABC transporter substrate-binding protein [Chloroflexota bacterium]|nr:peptide ABC transporter substrate-binding protein [Chloroflexota bacterium]
MFQLSSANRVLSIVVMAAVVTLMAACGSSPSGATSKGSGKTSTPAAKGMAGVLNSEQNQGDAQWVSTLDPAIVTDSISIYDIELVNANLVKLDYPSLKVIPDLASRWTTSSDHMTYTFYIRPNAKFSNGDPVTAYDAAWSIARSLLPATKSPVATTYLGAITGASAVAAGKATTVSGVKVMNAHTLQIHLDKPIAYFLGTLSYPTAEVLDPKVMKGQPAASYLTNDCMGNVGAGPFEFVCRNSSNGKSSFYPSGRSPYMQFKPNPYYYGAKPTIQIHAPFYATSDDSFHAFQAGQLDDSAVPTADLGVAQKNPGFLKKSALATDYITPNAQIAPFNNVHCRLAVSYAVDRVHITQDLLHGVEGPLYDVLPPGLVGYFSDGKSMGVPYYDTTKAKQELAMCPGHLSNAVMTYQNTSSDTVHEYDIIKGDLQAIGANVTLKPLTFNSWLKVVGQTMMATKGQENITENLWLDDYPDAQDWMQNLLYTGANYDIGGFSNPQYDKLVDAGNVEFNAAKRAQDYTQAQKIVLNDGGWIGVGYVDFVAVVNTSRVHGLIDSNYNLNPIGNDWSKVTVS